MCYITELLQLACALQKENIFLQHYETNREISPPARILILKQHLPPHVSFLDADLK